MVSIAKHLYVTLEIQKRAAEFAANGRPRRVFAARASARRAAKTTRIHLGRREPQWWVVKP